MSVFRLDDGEKITLLIVIIVNIALYYFLDWLKGYNFISILIFVYLGTITGKYLFDKSDNRSRR